MVGKVSDGGEGGGRDNPGVGCSAIGDPIDTGVVGIGSHGFSRLLWVVSLGASIATVRCLEGPP